MTITAPVQGLSLAALARLVALPLPSAVPPSAQSRAPDVVVFSSAPFRLLSDLAGAGLRQLTALLPALEQALQDDGAVSLGYLAKAAGAAARQIAEGHVALIAEGPERVAASLRGELPAPATEVSTEANQVLRTLARQPGTASEAEPAPATRTNESLRTLARQLGTVSDAAPTPEPRANETLRTVARQIGTQDHPAAPRSSEPEASPIERWLSDAELVLRGTGDVLDRAEQRLAALPQATAPETPSAWALAQITAAQVQVTAAYGSLGHSLRAPRRAIAAAAATSFALSADRFAGATTMLGMLLVLGTLWLAGGLWSLVTGIAGLIALGLWVVRISRASSGVSLDVRR
ncbi:MAG: hypothetical protein ACRYF2_26085 [Janthinobacterium lividum]